MKNATQPNGISFTPGNCSSAIAELAREVVHARLVDPPRRRLTAGCVECARRRRSSALTQNRARSAQSENGFWSTSSATTVTRPNP